MLSKICFKLLQLRLKQKQINQLLLLLLQYCYHWSLITLTHYISLWTTKEFLLKNWNIIHVRIPRHEMTSYKNWPVQIFLVLCIERFKIEEIYIQLLINYKSSLYLKKNCITYQIQINNSSIFECSCIFHQSHISLI